MMSVRVYLRSDLFRTVLLESVTGTSIQREMLPYQANKSVTDSNPYIHFYRNTDKLVDVFSAGL